MPKGLETPRHRILNAATTWLTWMLSCCGSGIQRSLLPLFVLCCSLCFGQSLSIGVKGGVRTTDDITGDATSESKRYTVGPTVEIGLPLRFSIEFAALYRRNGYQTSFGDFAGGFAERERGNSWEFPILLKYRLPFLLARPYAEVGYAPRRISGSSDINGVFDQSGNRPGNILAFSHPNPLGYQSPG